MRAALLALLFVGVTSGAAQTPARTSGQAPPGADTLSPGAIADSLAVLRSLDSLVRREPNNAAAWYRRGMVAWALAHRDTIPPPVRETDWTLLGRMADTSLRRAAQAEPMNPYYHMMVGRYLLASGNSFARTGANTHFNRAADAAAGWEDPWMRAEALVEAGRVDWRRYDTFADRLPNSNGALRSLAQAVNIDGAVMSSLRPLVDAAREAKAFSSTERSGEADYLKAESRFREAYAAYPEHVRAFRQLAMLLAEKRRWTELSAVARDKVSRAPWDYLGWLTLGLAQHRLGDVGAATAAFDSAMTYISDEEYARLDNLERVLRRRDTSMTSMRDPGLRPATKRMYWLFANPLWSRPGSETRIEFLARVTYAELRWTVDELGVRGADTDRGDVHIRYGPADHVIAWGPDPDAGSFEGRSVSTLWAYEGSGLSFIFQGQPTFATARIPLSDRTFYEAQREDIPVRWDNIPVMQVDTIPVQAVRFRATGDSVDVVLAARPPVEAIAAASEVRGPVRTDVWLLAGGTVSVRRDSTPISPTGTQWWRQRLPLGNYVYRVEASADASLRAGRAAASLVANDDPFSGFRLRAFSASDLLVASSVEERRGVTPRRWSDLAIAPLAGPLPRNSDLALLWENYGLASRNGTASYVVSVTIRRDASVVGRVAARILGAGAVTSTMRTDDAVSVEFTKSVAHSDVIVDHLTVGLGDSPAGRYTVILRITDRTTGERSERVTRFSIAGR